MSTSYVGENDSLDTLWELREIDAWADGEGGWTWNDSFVLKRFRSDADDLKGLFLRVLADVRGRPLPRGVFRDQLGSGMDFGLVLRADWEYGYLIVKEQACIGIREVTVA